jgi:F0F1-type ATP synthase membrane subunit b/b'
MTDSYSGLIAAAIAISAIALLGQAIFVFAIYRSVKDLQARVEAFIPRAEHLLNTAEKMLAENRQEIHEVTSKASAILDIAHKQVERLDEFLTDTTDRARTQVIRIEGALEESVDRVQRTVGMLNDTMVKPIREINGLAAGLRAAFTMLFRSPRASVAQATADEEMFI